MSARTARLLRSETQLSNACPNEHVPTRQFDPCGERADIGDAEIGGPMVMAGRYIIANDEVSMFRQASRIWACAASVIVATHCCGTPASAADGAVPSRPNIVLINADDK